MINAAILDEFAGKLAGLLASSPARDLEKNARALLTSALSRLDLVTREEFELQKEMLARLREQLAALETRLAELEAKR